MSYVSEKIIHFRFLPLKFNEQFANNIWHIFAVG